MKKLLVVTLFISFKMFGQSVTIVPSNPEFIKIKKDGIGLDHRSSNGIVGVGTYTTPSQAYIQTHTPHSLNFSTNDGSSYMTLSYSATTSLNGNLGIANTSPQEKLHVVGNIRTSSLAGTGLRPVIADANGILKPSTVVAFAANLGVLFPIAANTALTVPFEVEQYDVGNNYDNTTYLFTAPVNGIYHFNATADWSSLTATSGGLNLYLVASGSTSTFAQSGFQVLANYKFSTNTISTDIKLNSGQTVKVEVRQNTTIPLQFTGNYNPYTAMFSGHLVLAL